MQAGTLDRQQMGLAVGQQMETDRQTEGSTERHPSLTVKPWLGVVDLAQKKVLHTATGTTQEAAALEGGCHAAAPHT